MKYFKKILSFIAMLALVIECMPISEVMAASNICYIKTADDLVKLASKCKSEKYSKDLNVYFTDDIDLRGSGFKTIPYFAGVIDGRDYTVRGVNIKQRGSCSGFIRENSGTIKNLSVDAVIMPDGSKKNIGIIAGKNSGTISECSAKGSAEGKENVGGIAGRNTGNISGCKNYAKIKGDLKTGGIAGLNDGTISECYNYGSINERSSANESDSVIKINLSSLKTVNSTLYEITGGIAGQNNDVIKDSHNYGKIGYIYVGNKTGGIAGVQSGNITNCTNNADILGKNEVGGIVGRLIPEITTLYDDKGDSIKNSLEKTEDSIDALGDNLDNNKLNKYFDNIIDTVGDIQNSIDSFGDDFNGDADAIFDVVKEQNGILKDQTDSLISEFDTFSDDLDDDIDEISDSVDDFRDALDNAKDIKDLVSGDLRDTIDTHLDNIEDTSDIMSDDLNDVSDDLDAIKDLIDDMDSIMFGDESAADKARRMAEVFDDYDGNSIEYSLKKIRRKIEDIEDYSSLITKNFTQISRSVDDVLNTYTSVQSETKQIISEILAMLTTMDETELTAVSKLLQLMQNGELTQENIEQLMEAIGSDADTMSAIAAKASALATKIQELINYLDSAYENISSAESIAKKNIQSLISNLSKVHEYLTDIADWAEVIVINLQDMYYVAKDCKDIILGDDTESEKLNKFADAFDEYEEKDVALKENVDKVRADMSDLKDEITSTRESLEPINDKISDYSDKFSDEADAAADRLDAATQKMNDDVKDYTDKLSDRLKIVSESLDIVSDSVTDFLTDTNDSAHSLNKDLSASTDVLTDNATAVKDEVRSMKNQFRDDFDKVMDNADEVTDKISDLTDKAERTSVNVYDDLTGNGVIANCVNNAEVNGRSRIGGISGTSAENLEFEDDDDRNENEDLTDFIDSELDNLNEKDGSDKDTGIIEKAANNSYSEVSAVIAYCTNNSVITAKSDYVGGVLGRGYVGAVVKCADTDYVISTDGGYAGGIVGRSAGDIISSYSVVTLSGNDYIGGIVGSGNNVSDCVSMADFEKYDEDSDDPESYGAIAGYAGGNIKNNIYISSTMAGIDEVDYPEKAESAEYSDIASMDGIPDMFKKMRVSFIADNETVSEIYVDYGTVLTDSKIPQIPKSDSGYGEWEDFSEITNYKRVYALYSKYTTTISTGENKARVLAEGDFTSNAVLNVSDLTDSISGYKTLLGYTADVEDVNISDEIRYRVLFEDADDDLKVFANNGGEYVPCEYDIDGSYLVFSAPPHSAFLITKPNLMRIVIPIIIGVILLLAVLIFIKRNAIRQKIYMLKK